MHPIHAGKTGFACTGWFVTQFVVAKLTGRPVEKRLAGNLAIALSAVEHGAAIVRVHEVAETVDALKVWMATR